MKQILTIQLYKFSDENLHSILKEVEKKRLFDSLPDFMVNKHGKIVHPEEYLQFFSSNFYNNDAYYFFNVHSADIYLDYEINEVGLDSKYGIMGSQYLGDDIDWNIIFDRLEPQTFTEYKAFSLGKEIRLVYDVHYVTSYDYYSGGSEVECEINFLGWLNEDLKLIKF